MTTSLFYNPDLAAPDPELGSALRRSDRLATVLMVLLALCGFLFAPVMGSLALRLHVHRRAASGEIVTEDERTLSDGLFGVSLLAEVALMAVALVVWFFWLYRSYANLLMIGVRKARFTPRWAVGSWFVPFLNVFRAYQVMKDLWWRSEGKNSGGVWDEIPGPNVIVAWWAAYLLSHFVDRGTTDRRTGFGPEVEIWGMLVSAALDLVAAALAFVIVRTIRDHQNRWLETAGGEPSAG